MQQVKLTYVNPTFISILIFIKIYLLQQRWFDTKEDDGQIVRELVAGGIQLLNSGLFCNLHSIITREIKFYHCC